MKTFCVTCAAPSWTKISILIDEMRAPKPRHVARHPELATQHTSLEAVLLSKFKDILVDLCFCVRYYDMPEPCYQTSRARMWKNGNPASFNAQNNISEEDRTLGFEVMIDEKLFKPIKRDKTAQRRLIEGALWRCIEQNLPKYKKKIPLNPDELQALLDTIKSWFVRYEWLSDEEI